MIVNLIEPAFPVPQMTQDIVGRDGLAVIGSDGSKSQIVIEVPLFETETRNYFETRFATETRNHEPEPLNLEDETRNSKRDGLPVIGSDGSKSQIVIEVSNTEPDTISTPKLETISKSNPGTISKPKPKTMDPNP